MRKTHPIRIEQAYKDALTLAGWKYNGILPSRRYAAIYGISQNHFENAVALLRLARIVTKHRTWTVDDYPTIKTRLAAAKQYALDVPEAYHARLTNHART